MTAPTTPARASKKSTLKAAPAPKAKPDAPAKPTPEQIKAALVAKREAKKAKPKATVTITPPLLSAFKQWLDKGASRGVLVRELGLKMNIGALRRAFCQIGEQKGLTWAQLKAKHIAAEKKHAA